MEHTKGETVAGLALCFCIEGRGRDAKANLRLPVSLCPAENPAGVVVHNRTEDGRALARFAPALLLLFLAMLINYVDRGNLSVAAPLLQREWHVSSSTLGVLFSAFFWTYTVMQFASGWLTDRLGSSFVMGLGFLVWSLATAATGLVPGFALLFVMRLMLGVGESVIFPASSKILAENLPEDGRGFANGVICAGMKSGPALGTFAGGLLMAHYGWRWTFLTIGMVSLLWMPAWMRWGARNSRAGRSAEECGPSTVDILRQPVFWGVTLAHFCSNSVHYFTSIWMPLYLMNEIHLSMEAMARTAGLYFLGEATAALITGWVADILIRRGRTASMVRKSIMALGFGIAAVGLACCAVFGPRGALWCLPVMALGCGMGASGVFAFPQTLAGPLAAGRWVGLQNGLANLAGVVAPALTGFLVDRTGSFAAPLLMTAGMAIASGWAYVFLTGPLEQVRWPKAAAHAVTDVSSPAQ